MRGFTVIEIIVAVSIALLLVAVGLSITIASREAWFTSDASVSMRQEIMKAFMQMEKELKETRPAQTNLNVGGASASISFKIPQDNDLDGTILNAGGNVEWSGDIAYGLNADGQITRTDAGGTTVLANNITALQFTRPASDPKLLRIDVTAQKLTIAQRTMQDTEQLIIKMRN